MLTLIFRSGVVIMHKDDCFITDDSYVCIHWKIKTTELSEEERATIKDRIVQAAKSIDCWFPYKINHIFDGSLVIGSSLPEGIFERKATFENSIRKFLDKLVEVSGIRSQRSIHIDVEMHISKSQHTGKCFTN